MLLVGMQTGAATLENSMEFLKKLKIELPSDPAIALLGIYAKDTKILIPVGHLHPDGFFFFFCTLIFIAVLSTIAKLWKELKCPSTDE